MTEEEEIVIGDRVVKGVYYVHQRIDVKEMESVEGSDDAKDRIQV